MKAHRRPIAWRFRSLGVAVVLLCVAGLAPAIAQAKAFGIADFAIEPTERTVETEVSPNTFKFVNEPYTRPFTQAGGHPWALTTRIAFLTETIESPEKEAITVPTGDPKDIVTELPPGLLGDPMAVPRCSLTQVTSSSEQCPADTQVGVYTLGLQSGHQLMAPIVNVTPEAGQSAEFALENTTKFDTPLLTGRLVRTTNAATGHSQYGFAVVSAAIPLIGIERVEATFWGVPGDPSHDPMRGRICRATAIGPVKCEGGHEHFGYSPVVPFVTLGTDCSAGPEIARLRADSWEEPGTVGVEEKYSAQWQDASAPIAAVTGCDVLAFKPTIEARPDTLLADEPVGMNIGLEVPLSETAASFATPQVRNSTVTLPEGMSVNPGVVDGIEACEEFGSHGINITGPESEEIGLNGELQLAPGHCPDASIVGTAEAVTPFLPIPVKGHVYLAKPGCGGPGHACTEQDALDGNLYRLYLELGGTGELARTGIHLKVPMQTQVNLATGQLTATVLETPQAPFSELKIHLNGGPRAPLANPATCGQAVTTSDFTPWSAPGALEGEFVSGTADATPSSFFEVEGCASPVPFKPGFQAGTVTADAGQFSTFTMELSRRDREQYVKGIQLHTPPGLLGVLASVPLCDEVDANEGKCSSSSLIGTTRVQTGAGSHPFEIEGNVYLTGPYRGAPFGVSITVHVVAGPFNLGIKVVRARIDVNPSDSTLTITTDETGPYAVPQIVFGVPVRLQRVTVNVDRPNFMFNPTNCDAHQVGATVTGNEDTVANVSSPFATGACKSLTFKPIFKVTTSGHTSRTKGASLDAKLSYPAGSFGSAANIARVKVDLPKRLPSRLTTLQKACPASIFHVDPSSCPAASVVGIVRSTTPLLPGVLDGPVYFVSHGGEAFPSLIVVLQGDGVRVDLTGTTFISKSGITSSTFKTVPDVPVNSFELYLPEGKYSALAATGALCKVAGKLRMPTEFVAQNGIVLRQSTTVTVTGCAPGKAKTARRVSGKRRAAK